MSTVAILPEQEVLKGSLAAIAADIDSLLEALLRVPPDPSAPLLQEMRYAAIGGKRLRPVS